MPNLPNLLKAAGIRARAEPSEELRERIRTLSGLVEMQRAQLITGVWCGNIEGQGGPRIESTECGDLRLGWEDARRLVAEYRTTMRMPIELIGKAKRA